MLGSVFGPLEELQDSIQQMLDQARGAEDKSMQDALLDTDYPDHIVVGVVLAMHYATENVEPLTTKNVFDAILFLDKLDTMNIRVVSK